MKKFLIFSGLLIIALCQISQTFAQEVKEISQVEFNRIEDSADRKTNLESRRTILKSQHYKHISDKEPYFQRTITTERAGKSFYEIIEDKEGEKIERTEMIEINNRKYKKESGGKWKDVTNAKNGGGGFAVAPLESQETIEHRYLGKQTLDGQTVDVYEKKITRQYEKLEGLSINEEKLWIDQKGRYLKTESKSRQGDKHIYQDTVEYQYDPRIKITAPKIR